LFPGDDIFLCGDFNQLDDQTVSLSTGLHSLVSAPTRGLPCLDHVYTSSTKPLAVKVVKSSVKSDHSAVVVTDGLSFVNQLKKTKKVTYTPKSPSLHAFFLSHFDPSSYQATLNCSYAKLCADQFYLNTFNALHTFYPTRSITVSDHDPPFVTPEIKSLLRKKNHLMNKGHTTEASSVAEKIGKIIARANSTRLSHIDPRQGTKTVWEEVGRLQRSKSSLILPKSITPDSLNLHYSSISTDSNYSCPPVKLTTTLTEVLVEEQQIFHILDTLSPTATGPDQLPSWFLRLGAPIFSKSLTHLNNLSLL
jgi:hypothetical protein